MIIFTFICEKKLNLQKAKSLCILGGKYLPIENKQKYKISQPSKQLTMSSFQLLTFPLQNRSAGVCCDHIIPHLQDVCDLSSMVEGYRAPDV